MGGGKSTAAEALADVLREAGRVPAVIDLDLVYCMARQKEGFGDEGVWRIARRAAASLAGRFFGDGLDLVIVEGSFHDESECGDVRDALNTDVETKVVALNVSYEETVRRVEADPAADRVLSRDPKVLRYLHSRFVEALPFLVNVGFVIDADALTPLDTARAIASRVTGEKS